MDLEFIVEKANAKDHLVVAYACDCGCHPQAHYYKGSAEAGHEHCCCGKVHFTGPEAERQLNEYLAERRENGDDEGLAYVIKLDSVTAPWGERIPVAYGLPHVEGEQAPVQGHSHSHGHDAH